MRRMALSLELLNELEYHWFYGIRAVSGNKKSLGKELEALLGNEELKQRLRERVESVKGFFILYRLLFWLFNSGYRQEYCLLSACESYEYYKEEYPHLKDAARESARKKGWFYTRVERLSRSAYWFDKQLEAVLVKDAQTFSVEPKEEGLELNVKEKQIAQSESFSHSAPQLGHNASNPPNSSSEDVLIRVTQALSVALSILEISVRAGDSVYLSQAVKAYRQQALKTHPDKNKSPNAQEEFIAVNEAYQSVLEAAQRQLRYAGAEDDFINERYQYVDKLFREFKDKAERYMAEANAYIKDANDLIADVKDLNIEFDRYMKKADQYIADCDDLFQLVDTYFLQVERKKEALLAAESSLIKAGLFRCKSNTVEVLAPDEVMADDGSLSCAT